MNIFRDFTLRVQHALKQIEIDGTDWDSVDLSRVVVEPPRDAAHGDLATNAAMVLAKNLGMKPRDLAEKLTAVLTSDTDIEGTSVAGPGFVNIKLKSDFWTTHLVQILKSGDGYGKNYVEAPRKVNVEYVSANPTGPMHVGHCRGAVVGDAIASLLEFAGHDVTREYYINDAGSQINVLAQSVYLRYCEALGEDIGEIPEGLYPGDYLVPLGKELAEMHGQGLKEMPEEERNSLLKEAAIDGMMDLIRADLAQLNVHHDLFFSERTLHADAGNGSAISATVSGLRDRGLVYDGTLPPPKGKLPDDWEDREQTLFKATDFGDDIDRPLAKSDGSYTYFAADVAYFRDKYERGFQDMLFILGADHGGYVKRLQAVCKAIAGDEARLSVLLCQLVKLMRAGEPVKMSKRSGNLITLRDVVEEVGVDPVRFMMLNRKSDAPLDFDFEKVTEQSKDNPVFYVQYAHARCKSIFRQAKEELGSDFEQLTADLSVLSNEELAELSHESELQLIQKMAAFPRLIETAAEAREPHRLAFYLYDLASAFHGHWNKGKSEVGLRFINADNRNSTKVRLALVQAIANVLAIGLSILGVSAPEEMR